MCTLVILRRPCATWPLLLAANRDELYSRPSLRPGRHWPDRLHIRAGLDLRAGGAWLGVNDAGVIAGLLNRYGTFQPDPGSRSRGDIVLRALDHATACHAAEAFAAVDPTGWRPFNLIVADADEAFWLCHKGGSAIVVTAIPPGQHMIEGGDLDDAASPRLRHYRSRLLAARVPEPGAGDWGSWQEILADREGPAGRPEAALCIAEILIPGAGLAGTVSSALLALPRHGSMPAVFLHADGPPDSAFFLPVAASRGEAMPLTQCLPANEPHTGSIRQEPLLGLENEVATC
jgi:uncharacterized protein with NRDE domain